MVANIAPVYRKHQFTLKSKLIQFIHKILDLYTYLHIKSIFMLIVSANGIVFDIGYS